MGVRKSSELIKSVDRRCRLTEGEFGLLKQAAKRKGIKHTVLLRNILMSHVDFLKEQ